MVMGREQETGRISPKTVSSPNEDLLIFLASAFKGASFVVKPDQESLLKYENFCDGRAFLPLGIHRHPQDIKAIGQPRSPQILFVPIDLMLTCCSVGASLELFAPDQSPAHGVNT